MCMKQKIKNIFKCIKEQNAQKQGGDGKLSGGMHKFKWVSVKRVVGMEVCLFLKECCFRVRVRVEDIKQDTFIREVGK